MVAAFEGWMRAERARLSRHAAVAKAIDYMVTRWEAFTRFLEDGRICLSNNAPCAASHSAGNHGCLRDRGAGRNEQPLCTR